MKSNLLQFTFKLVLIVAAVMNITACNNEKNSKEEKAGENTGNSSSKTQVFDNLVGVWQNESDKSYEEWKKNENGTYDTRVYAVQGADTTIKEKGKVYPENDKWVYENIAVGQNDGKAIRFTSSSMSDKSVQFSNPAHDFPTDINYTVADANTVNAFIVGPNDKGGKDTIPFNYKRVK